MKAKKRFTKVVIGLSLCAFCYPVFLSLYIIQNCPAILRASGNSKGWYFVGGLGNGILFFFVVWLIYGVIRWLLIWPLCLAVKYFSSSKETQKMSKAKGEQNQ